MQTRDGTVFFSYGIYGTVSQKYRTFVPGKSTGLTVFTVFNGIYRKYRIYGIYR